MSLENDLSKTSEHVSSGFNSPSNRSSTFNGFDLNKLQLDSEAAISSSESRVFDADSDLKKGSLDARTKSSLRIRYEAEVKIIRRKLGDLEQIRATLGLTQRKICQLLFVDPSAWTRWTKPGEEAPPHIYRMLQWYLALEDKYPALDTTFWLSAVAKIRAPVEDQRELEILRARHEELRAEVRALRDEAGASMIRPPIEPPPVRQSTSQRLGIIVLVMASFLVGAGCAAWWMR